MNQELRIRNKKFSIRSIIRNSLFIIRKSEGFTLIELLVVILVIFSVGILIASILVSALRGSNKTNTIDLVRRNGNSAITQMSRTIRYAQSFDGVSIDGTADSYTTSCVPQIGAIPAPPNIVKLPESGLQSFWSNMILRFENFKKKELAGISNIHKKIAYLDMNNFYFPVPIIQKLSQMGNQRTGLVTRLSALIPKFGGGINLLPHVAAAGWTVA